jgi:hypothetical protein
MPVGMGHEQRFVGRVDGSEELEERPDVGDAPRLVTSGEDQVVRGAPVEAAESAPQRIAVRGQCGEGCQARLRRRWRCRRATPHSDVTDAEGGSVKVSSERRPT